MKTYTTRDEATYREIEEALGQWAAEHDVEAIADRLIEQDEQGQYYLNCTVEEFWDTVLDCAF